MLINPNIVRQLRRDKSWTQQQLGDTCQVSLRTIQRVERTGSASLDTVEGLCAVFEVEKSELLEGSARDAVSQSQTKSQEPKLYTVEAMMPFLMVAAAIGGGIGAGMMYMLLI